MSMKGNTDFAPHDNDSTLSHNHPGHEQRIADAIERERQWREDHRGFRRRHRAKAKAEPVETGPRWLYRRVVTPDMVAEMRRMREKGMSIKEVGKAMNLHYVTVSIYTRAG